MANRDLQMTQMTIRTVAVRHVVSRLARGLRQTGSARGNRSAAPASEPAAPAPSESAAPAAPDPAAAATE